MFFDIFEEGTGKELYGRIVSFVESNGMDKMLRKGVLVGLSGGADSVFLLRFLARYLDNTNAKIIAVHINHLLRGDEALRDEDFSRRLCADMGIEFISLRIDVAAIAKESSLGIEECARDIRYSEFQRIISGRDDVSSIAVAHNATDNAETIFLNMLRGAGSRGCAGIPPIRENICRPVLCVSKAEIVHSLSECGCEYVFDSSNASTLYSRNYVRHEILPKLGKLSHNPEQMLLRLSSNLRADDDFILSAAKEFLQSTAPTSKALNGLHPAVFMRVVSLMVGDLYGISSTNFYDIKELLRNDNFKYSLPKDKLFVCERGLCKVVNKKDIDIDYCASFVEDEAHIDVLNTVSFLSDGPFDNSYLNVYKKSIQVSLGSAIIEGELRLRPKMDGDTVYYGGMTHKLKKLYNDRKIPPSLRHRIPVLCDDRGVVWVPGFGVRDDNGEGRSKIYVALCSHFDENDKSFLSGFDFK